MSSVIIIGDPHLGKSCQIGKIGIGAGLNSRIVDQLNLLDWILDSAIDKAVDNIIITGDIFDDPKPSSSLITLFISWLKKCQAHDITVNIIMGNHDMLRNGSVLYSPMDIISTAELDNISVYQNIDTITIGTTAFTLIPFKDRKMLNAESNADAVNLIKQNIVYELSSIPQTYCKIVVGHLALEGSIPVGDEIDNLSDLMLCPLNMFQDYNYVWMGHVHKPQILKKHPHIAHIGSMDISNFSESDQQKHIVIFDCLSHSFEIEYLPTRTLQKLSIKVPQDTDDPTSYVVNKINELSSLQQAIVKIEVELPEKSKSINKSTISKALNSCGVFNVAGIIESKKQSVIKPNSIINNKMDITSAIKMYSENYIDESLRNEAIEIMMNIYNSYKAEEK